MNGEARILVVDDERLIRWTLGERLSRDGYEVVSAESGEQALEIVERDPPDVMLVDVRLPGIDGVQTLKRSLQLQPEMAVLMMSAHGTVDVAVGAMKQGAVDFLVKPFPTQSLHEAIKRALSAAQMRQEVAAQRAAPAPGRAGAIAALVGGSAAMEQVRQLAARVAASETATVLVEGESGSGKEVVARAIHLASRRADKPFLQVNCAALPDPLLESELFGHERGAFTDAHALKKGLFESAEGGGVMLDEIGDLPPAGQAKLLRLLENKTFRRVGGLVELKTDARVIAATNIDLEERVSDRRFRADLFFRLNVVRIQVPALRERREDVPQLVAHFFARFNEQLGRKLTSVSLPAMEALLAYDWPGNVRELRNVVERVFILYADAEELRLEHLPVAVRQGGAGVRGPAVPQAGDGLELKGVERRTLAEAMERAQGNQTHAAKVLGISRDTLRYRLKKHGML